MIETTFADLGLSGRLLRALEDAKYETPTPIQKRAIPLLLQGSDVLGVAQTGTGKTAAFVLPLLHAVLENKIYPKPRGASALILAPTRELVVQITDNIKAYARHMRLRHAIVMGGVGHRPQINALKKGVDILIATPGRLNDLIRGGHVDLSATEFLVLDEADRMLDMGFIHDVRTIVSRLAKKRQTLLFSATMPPQVAKLAREILNDPQRVEIEAKTVAVDRIDQRVHHLNKAAKTARLAEILTSDDLQRAIVFTRTKHGADRVVKQLSRGGINAEALHGNKSQGARQRTLDSFRSGRLKILIATDIASRGIDVDDISHVINFELPNEPESYVHRIGRTARAGASGIAISFCDETERGHLRSIERLLKRPLTVVGEEPVFLDPSRAKPKKNHRRRPENNDRKRRRPARRAA